MGGGRWSPEDWSSYATTRAYDAPTTKTEHIYASRKLTANLNPKNVKFRESCDSKDNPNSTPIIIGLDVTGSMHTVLDSMARTGLNTLATEIYNRRPVSDPHIMVLGVGDVEAGDTAPLQATQFEADIRIADQMTQIYLEGGGGGNDHESYLLPWYFAAFHTKIDSMPKRGKKGYLFTIGDEMPQTVLKASDVKKVLGYQPQVDLTAQDLLDKVSQNYHVFHLLVAEGNFMRLPSRRDAAIREWKNLLGQQALLLEDHTKLAEVIVSAIQVVEGTNSSTVINSWDPATAGVVREAVGGLSSALVSVDNDASCIRL